MKIKKQYRDMTTSELQAATRKFDQPLVIDGSRDMSTSDRKRWQAAKKKRGRPRIGAGHCRISVSLERGLLKRATALAKQRGVSRSSLLAELLVNELATK